MGKQIKQFSPFEKELAEFKEKYKGVVYDFTVKKNEKQARSDRFAIGKVVSALDSAHKELKAPLLEKTKLLDSQRKEIKDGLLEIQGDIKAQIDKHEQIEKDRVDAIKERIALIKTSPDKAANWGAEAIGEILKKVEAIKIDDTFAEFQQEALFTKMDAAMALQPMYDDRLAFETKQAEQAEATRQLEEKARKEREEQIAEQARLDAEKAAAKQVADAKEAQEKAERDAKQAKEDAERDKAQAVEDAKKEAQRKADDEERARVQKENDRKAAEATRLADEEHRIKIEQGVIDGLVAAGLQLMDAKVVIDAIEANAIPNLTINY